MTGPPLFTTRSAAPYIGPGPGGLWGGDRANEESRTSNICGLYDDCRSVREQRLKDPSVLQSDRKTVYDFLFDVHFELSLGKAKFKSSKFELTASFPTPKVPKAICPV